MNTLTKIKQWLSNTELAKTLKNRDVLGTIKLPIFFTLLLLPITINFQIENLFFGSLISIYNFLLSNKLVVSFLIAIYSTIYYILSIYSEKEELKKHSQVVLTMLFVTFFELLYIWSYSPKMMIPEGMMEAVLIALPAFKFCVFIYVVTLNRVRNEATEANKKGE
ncbi:hypothetical protein [Moritella viscosa]|nr:hypothetical protein [Moritella viscosa]